jgi:hypothetical protein
MVSTRSHPSQFPPPDLSPTKAIATSTGSPTKRSARSSHEDDDTNGDLVVASRSRGRSNSAWSHTPGNLILLWLAVSLPLVAWDTGYVLGRPHTMPGGKLHKPLWQLYDLYGTVDHLYGFPAWQANNGFTGAQGALNVFESLVYVAYLWVVFQFGRKESKKQGATALSRLLPSRKLVGREAGLAVILGFAAAVMTLAKTILYCEFLWPGRMSIGSMLTLTGLVLYFADFEGIRHNEWPILITLWVIPK